jgi:post-segregation antitoxin (ccd killing protein)
MSWVTLDRICQEEADGKEDVRRELVRNGKPLRSSAEPLSDDELLAKLRDFGLNWSQDLEMALENAGRTTARYGSP